MTILNVDQSPKMLRETLCLAQCAISTMFENDTSRHLKALQELIDECDSHRPLGPDGKHGNRHTQTCGCEDK